MTGGIPQHALAMKAVSVAGCIDQVDLTKLAAVEVLLREAQMVEYHYQNVEKDKEETAKKQKGHSAAPLTSEEMMLFQGTGKSHFESMICPDLMEHIAKALERDANILKQSRKAREERALARK